MRIELHDKNHFIVGHGDKATLELLQQRADGSKVRGQNKIIIPLKSGPKIYRFANHVIDWGNKTKDLVTGIYLNIKNRKENIKKIRAQYGGQIDFDYDYKGTYSVMEHQKILYNSIMYTDCAALLAQPGTCKTGPYLWAIDQRIKTGKVKKALVITLSTLKRNVIEEAKVQVPHLKAVVLSNKDQARKILQKTFKVAKKNIDYDVYISNYESIFSLVELFDDDYFDMVILDEAHRIGSHQSRQTKSIIDKFEFTKYKYIITGTLHSNNLMSFFMPFRFMGPDTVPYAKYQAFRQEYMIQVDEEGRIWAPKPGSKSVVQNIIGNLSVVFTKEECVDLPPIIRQVLYCELSGEQKEVYEKMKKDLVASIDNMCSMCNMKNNCDSSCNENIVAKNALVLSSKLRQIACGFYINTRVLLDESGSEKDASNIIRLKENPKLSLLIQALENIPKDEKIIIWANNKESIRMISERLHSEFGKDSYLTCFENQNAFDQIEKFRSGKSIYMVANPSKMGVGHNIQFSSYQIFFSNSYSYVQRDQAESRQHRKGQKNNVTVIDIVAKGSIDELILRALSQKKDLSITLSELARVLKTQSL